MAHAVRAEAAEKAAAVEGALRRTSDFLAETIRKSDALRVSVEKIVARRRSVPRDSADDIATFPTKSGISAAYSALVEHIVAVTDNL